MTKSLSKLNCLVKSYGALICYAGSTLSLDSHFVELNKMVTLTISWVRTKWSNLSLAFVLPDSLPVLNLSTSNHTA
ncbi:hypothetical protein [Glaesserella sp.]|uniref:hypothetical protein n=1 Tax=Glaesserella sp. TaxID=2094731 RepID=UPI0035A19B6D